MKKIIMVVLSLTTLVFSWNLQEVIDSEGIQTNVIICDNGETKAIYYSSDSGKYEVTPTLMFDTLEEASRNICGE
jgi:hypothetical protein